VEKEIDAADVMSRLRQILEEIYREEAIYTINLGESKFVLGPAKICGVALSLVGRDRGWPVKVQIDEIKNVDALKPEKRKYPFICRNETCLAVAITSSDYEAIKKNLERPKPQLQKEPADNLPMPATEPERRTSRSWAEGQIVAGIYQVLGVLGEGSFGTVYKVRHQLWQQDLAVKVPKKQTRSNKTAIERFYKEAQTWTELGLHPNIVTCYYVRELGKVPRIFLECVEGGDLREKIQTLTLEESVDYGIQICRGVGYAHEHGLVHRDLKPENCLLTKDGILKVTDFGLVKIQETIGEDSQHVGKTGRVGTAEYMAPEQWTDPLRVTYKADVWALGTVLYEMCSGDKAFNREEGEPSLTFYERMAAKNWAHNELPKKVPYKLVKIIEQCLKVEATERPESLALVEGKLTEIYEKITKNPYPKKKVGQVGLLAASLNNKGVSFVDLKKTEEALSAFSEALRVDPSYPEAVYNQALLLWKKGEITDLDAVDRVKAASVNLPSVWRPHYLLGLIHMARQDAESALSALEEAEKISPQQPEIQTALEKVSAEKPNWPRCLRTLEGHTGSVKSVGINGELALTGCSGGMVKIWRLGTGQCIQTFRNNGGGINSVIVPEDYSQSVILVGSEDKDFASFWNLETGERVRTLHNPSNVTKIQSLAFSADGKNALTACDENVQFWELSVGGKDSMELKAELKHKEFVSSVALSNYGSFAITGSWDNIARIWNLQNGECKFILKGHLKSVNSVGLSHDGRFALTGSLDHTARLWDLESGKCISVLKGHSLSVDAIACSYDAKYALTASRDHTARLWNLKTGECVRTLLGHKAGVVSVAFSNDGKFAITGSSDQTARLWSLGNGERSEPLLALGRVRSLEEEVELQSEFSALVDEIEEYIWEENWQKAVDSLSKARALPGYERHPDAMALWAKIGQKGVRINCKAAWCVRNIEVKGEMSTVIYAAFSADARFAVTASEDLLDACVWNLEIAECVPLQGHLASVCSVALSPDGKLALTGSTDQTARLWDAKTGKCLRVLRGHSSEVRFVAFSPDCKKALTGDTDGAARLWDLRTGECKFELSGHEKAIHVVSFSPDSRHILTGSLDQTARLWGAKTGKCLVTLVGHTGEIDALTFSSDGKLALTGSGDNTARVWDLKSGECKRILQGHSNFIRSVSFSPDNKLALTGSADKTACLWELKTGTLLRVLRGHNGPVASVAFSPDGKFALTGSWDNTARIWDFKKGESIISLTGHTGSVALVMFSPDCRYALTASYDKTIRVWECDWDYRLPTKAEWNEEAKPYIDTFLSIHTPYFNEGFNAQGGPEWTHEDFEKLFKDLSFRGFGWLTKQGIQKKLEESTTLITQRPEDE
jgi:WD40 repeat protein/serine/threonine protein kinase